eukprot:CAMPEP_0202962634 /NCGR_PEP_ID=MMETSP1396-20130829/6741_1 /ASSEMBLY_ACC=CAM_ASM_000872 /TAXON_ID= /ORGANISM="Pseudokeronopsis sp., Strain Brazil" /LENGTH=39 /DNA_ID= /DNA_START= /DNA_END= /DNA_ORIENTATION=
MRIFKHVAMKTWNEVDADGSFPYAFLLIFSRRGSSSTSN